MYSCTTITHRQLILHTKLANTLVARCASQAATTISKRRRLTRDEAIREKPDKIIMYERKSNRWKVYKAAGISTYVLGVPLAINTFHFGLFNLELHWLMPTAMAFFYVSWWVVITAGMARHVRVLEYCRHDKKFLVTVLGKWGQPLVKEYPVGHLVYDGQQKNRILMKAVDKTYTVFTDKGTLENEDVLWHLQRKKFYTPPQEK